MLSSALRSRALVLTVCRLDFVCPLSNETLNVFRLKKKYFTAIKISGRQFTKSKICGCVSSTANLGKIVSLDPDEVETVYEETDYKLKAKLKKAKKKEAKKNDQRKDIKKDETSDFLENKSEKLDENDESPKENNIKYDYKTEKQAVSLLRQEIMSLHNKKENIGLEGKRLIHDALCANLTPKIIFFSKASLLANINLPPDVKLCWVPYNSLKLWSSVNTCSGLLGIFQKPTKITINKNINSLPLTVICDNIRDPGNMGSILRVAVGAGCRKILLTKGCVDIWESKVLRSAAGAHFQLLPSVGLLWEDIEKEVPEEDKVILADNELPLSTKSFDKDEDLKGTSFGKSKSSIGEKLPLLQYNSVDYGKESIVIVIGGETEGLSDGAYLFAEKRQGLRTFIPMSNSIESLNSAVALGVVLYEVRRQMEETSRRRFVNFV